MNFYVCYDVVSMFVNNTSDRDIVSSRKEIRCWDC